MKRQPPNPQPSTVTRESLEKFFASPEWAELTAYLQEVEEEAITDFVSNPQGADPVEIARFQVRINCYRHFSRGDVRLALYKRVSPRP